MDEPAFDSVCVDFDDFVLEPRVEASEFPVLPLPTPDVSPLPPALTIGLERMDSFDFDAVFAAIEDGLLNADPTPAGALGLYSSAAGSNALPDLSSDFTLFANMQSMVSTPDIAPLEGCACVPGSSAKRAAPLGSVASQLARMTRAEAEAATAPAPRARQPANIQHLQQRAAIVPAVPIAFPAVAVPRPACGAQIVQGTATHTVDSTPQPASAIRPRISP
jgi:hypothetical protein